MRNKIGDKQRLLHILDAINNIEDYTGGILTETFFNNSLIKSGCVFQLEIIGEAANRLSEELKEKYSTVVWHEIVSVRNIIAHFYWGIDYIEVWDIIKKHLPLLKMEVQKILGEL